MIREGDHVEATVKGDAIVLRRRDTLSDSAMIRLHAIRALKSMGIDPDLPHPELDTASELLHDRYITPIDALLVATAEVFGADVIVVSAEACASLILL